MTFQWESPSEGKQWLRFEKAAANMRAWKDEVKRSVEQRQSMSVLLRFAYKAQHKHTLDAYDQAIQEYHEALGKVKSLNWQRITQNSDEYAALRVQYKQAYIELTKEDPALVVDNYEYRTHIPSLSAIIETNLDELMGLIDLKISLKDSATDEGSRHKLYAASVAHT